MEGNLKCPKVLKKISVVWGIITIFSNVKKVKINLKDIIRLYNIKDFIKLFKCRFTIGTLDKLCIASLNRHWNCLKYKGHWLRILGDPRDGSTNFSNKFVAYGPPGTESLNWYLLNWYDSALSRLKGMSYSHFGNGALNGAISIM